MNNNYDKKIMADKLIHKPKWYPNSTGRECPMTCRFGVENNKYNVFLIKPDPDYSKKYSDNNYISNYYQYYENNYN
jgi:hypothetical protein